MRYQDESALSNNRLIARVFYFCLFSSTPIEDSDKI